MESTALIMNNKPQIYTGMPVQSLQFSADYFSRFIDYTDRKDSTVKGYLTCIRQFMLWMQQNNITQPGRDDIKAYRDHLTNSDLATGTQQQYLRAVKHFFKWTAAEGLYPNVADNIHGAKVRHDVFKKDPLPLNDAYRVAETIDRSDEQGKRLYCIFLLCVTCGLRCIEINRANVGDLKTAGDRCYLWVQGKGHDEKDTPVWIIPEVKEAITEYLHTREAEATAKSPLFTSTSNRSKGKRISTTTISTTIKELLIKAGYDSDRITAHSLRHTSNTAAYITSHNIYVAQKHARHSSPEITVGYVHAEEREQRQTEQQIYDYLFKGATTDKKDEALQILQTLDNEKLQRVIDFMKLLK